VRDVVAGRGGERVAARFHGTLAAAVEAMVRHAAERHGRLPVVLTGGCFQNPILAEAVAARLSADFPLLLHESVPPGDGGLALGQAAVAAAQLALAARTEEHATCA
jgi:hydrogenase maturation protein HypF